MRLSFEIDKLPEYCCECPCYDESGMCNFTYEDADKRPANCPLKEEQEYKWIPVKERLPELNERVLISAIEYGDSSESQTVVAISSRYVFRVFSWDKNGVELKVYDADHKWTEPWQYFHQSYRIVAWMPLPEPYKEEKDEQST